MKDNSDFVIILFSYRRPKLTKAAIERILEWDSNARLLISIDGLRSDASNEEHISWKKTIDIS